MTTEQMLPIIDKMDKVGYHSVECWGGATFDASLRFLKEDPWERLRKLRDGFKNTKLQMLFRGQNILGYRHYADDVVEYFVQKSIANGIDIIRIFDCLNDLRNLQTSVKACNKEGGHAQVALSYTLGDAYTLDYWKDMAKRIEDMGADSICIKDMAGLLVPNKATELVQALKDGSSLPIQLHTHYTSGVASMTYLKAVEAGCDVIDTAISPLALGTSQPATEVMAKTFEGTEFDPGLDQKLLAEIADYFRPLREEWIASGLLNPKVLGVNVKTLLYQVPGGMLSNLVSQLKEMGAEDKFEAVLEEVPRVRKDYGEPPLVTPSSQIVGTQAVLNVVTGERYKMCTKESKALVRGEYGQSVKPVDPEVKKKVIGDEKQITCRPADLLENELDKIEKEMIQYKKQDEDVLTYALFPQVATDFFKYREAQDKKVDVTLADKDSTAYPV
jgi:pyruvate/oxaloacetate carboxyltransferase